MRFEEARTSIITAREYRGARTPSADNANEQRYPIDGMAILLYVLLRFIVLRGRMDRLSWELFKALVINELFI